jgi:hypothetical protein
MSYNLNNYEQIVEQLDLLKLELAKARDLLEVSVQHSRPSLVAMRSRLDYIFKECFKE